MTRRRPQHPEMVTTDEMLDAHRRHLTAAGYSPTTITDAVELLRRVDQALPYGLPTATHDELVDWLGADRPRPWSRQTRKTYRDHLCRFYAWAAHPADPWIDRDPAIDLPAPRVLPGLPRPASHEQVAAALALPSPWRVHCALAAYAGLRPVEIARAERAHVTAEWVHVPSGKGDRARRVPTHAALWRIVAPLPPGPLTRRPRAGITADWVSKATARALRGAGVAISLYRLRHWYGTYVQLGAGDSRVTQQLTGHANLATVAVYTQVSDMRLRAAIEGLPDLT